MFSIVRRLCAVVAGLMVMAQGTAHADSIDCSTAALLPQNVCSATKTVIGTDLSVFSFEIESAGEYLLTMTDYEWPVGALGTLSAQVSSSTTVVDALAGSGSLTFFAAAGAYYVQVFAMTSSGGNAGLYGVMVDSVAPIPLPPAIWLFCSALAVLYYATRRRRIDDRNGRDPLPDWLVPPRR